MRILSRAAALAIVSLAACSGGGGDATPPITSNVQSTPGPTSSPLPPVGSPKPLNTLVPIATPTPTPIGLPSATPTKTAVATPVPAPGAPTVVSPGPTYKPNMLLTGNPYRGSSLQGGWFPAAIANALDYPVQYGFGGNGQMIAVIGTAIAAQSDLNAYASAAGLPNTPTLQSYPISGGNASPTTGDNEEATLDVETIAGLAPYAGLLDVDIPSATDQNLMMGMSTALGLDATVLSISFGGCELDSPSDDDAYDQITQQAAATGVTVVASSGDAGPACASGSTFPTGVSEPASDPYVVAAGGSEDLFQPPYTNYSAMTASIRNPQPWNDAGGSNGAGAGSGGGGISGHWKIPSYQNAPGIVSTAASSSNRNVPDVALPASNQRGPTAVYFQGGWLYFGGTSWSAPAFAAMQAEINQQCGSNRWGLPDLYRVFYQAPASFVDITTGNISSSMTSTTYAAGIGYDNASGLGLPLGEEIAVQDGC